MSVRPVQARKVNRVMRETPSVQVWAWLPHLRSEQLRSVVLLLLLPLLLLLTHTHTHTCTPTHTYTHVHTRTHTGTHACTHTHAHTHTQTHTHSHAHTHIHTLPFLLCLVPALSLSLLSLTSNPDVCTMQQLPSQLRTFPCRHTTPSISVNSSRTTHSRTSPPPHFISVHTRVEAHELNIACDISRSAHHSPQRRSYSSNYNALEDTAARCNSTAGAVSPPPVSAAADNGDDGWAVSEKGGGENGRVRSGIRRISPSPLSRLELLHHRHRSVKSGENSNVGGCRDGLGQVHGSREELLRQLDRFESAQSCHQTLSLMYSEISCSGMDGGGEEGDGGRREGGGRQSSARRVRKESPPPWEVVRAHVTRNEEGSPFSEGGGGHGGGVGGVRGPQVGSEIETRRSILSVLEVLT